MNFMGGKQRLSLIPRPKTAHVCDEADIEEGMPMYRDKLLAEQDNQWPGFVMAH